MNDKAIRKWYHDHGMEYIGEDWGERSDTGESLGSTWQRPQRLAQQYVVNFLFFPDDARLLWNTERTPEERELMERLEDFFEPYISLLPRAKGELVRQYMNDQLTLADMGSKAEGTSRQNAQQRLRVAVRHLVRQVALDDPEFRLTWPRDEEAEKEAAVRVILAYLGRP